MPQGLNRPAEKGWFDANGRRPGAEARIEFRTVYRGLKPAATPAKRVFPQSVKPIPFTGRGECQG